MATITSSQTVQARSATAGSPDDSTCGAALELRRLQRSLLRAVSDSRSVETLLATLGRVAAESLCPTAIRYFARDDEQHLVLGWQFLTGQFPRSNERLSRQFLALSEQACRKGFLQIDRFESLPDAMVVAVPVFLRNQPPESLVISIPASTQLLDRAIAVAQLLASHVTMWHILQEFNLAEADAQTTAALLEILAAAQAHDDLPGAGYAIASGLQESLSCQRVAIGIRSAAGARCRLIALSDHAKFDGNASFVRTVEAALDEALLRGTLAVWPPEKEADRHAIRAQQKLGKDTGAQTVISAPLATTANETIGAWLFCGDGASGQARDRADVIRASTAPVACCLQSLQRGVRGPVARTAYKIYENRRSWRMKAAIVVLGVLLGVLCVPARYRIKCECVLQPVTRRFVAAPFEGLLEKAMAGPGDVVRSGALLARMDGRAIRWELAGIEADRGQAAKRRDAGLATRDMVAAQLASLELAKLEQKTKVLKHRFENLEIKSPINGIVISGDQERAEGAPLTIGQALFEVAPLDQMVVELEIPEDDVSHVRSDMKVSVVLDALPRETLLGTVAKVHPRAEIKEDANVFIAEVLIKNSAGQLRPGMRGRAKILADRHTLAWNLFHKPWDFFVSVLGW